MPRTSGPPAYRLQKARGLAVVTIGGRDVYLGPHGSPESREKYSRLLLTHWKATAEPSPPPVQPDHSPISINGVLLQYLEFSSNYYQKHGKPTGETANIRDAVVPLKKLFGRTSAHEFGPKSLELVRKSMIESGLARTTINSRVGRIRRVFRWASREGLVPANTYHGLLCVEGLKRGRSAARETKRVRGVPDEHVQKACERVNDHVRAMIQVQELAGMRPQDILNLRTCDIDIDMHGDVWIYKPWTHKTEHHGYERKIAIGPKAQALLQPFLKPFDPDAFVFSPREAVEAFRKQRALERKSKRTPSQMSRVKKVHPKRIPAEQYTRVAYERAISRGCKKAGVPHWTPHQLRHNCATKVRKLFGPDTAAIVLGHRLGTVTEVYAEADFEKAIDAMREIG